jgi:anthranilate/para-aminobenzoate synthase component I
MGALLAGAEGPSPPTWVVSNSPETLVAVELGRGAGGLDHARSWPIKGTRPRGADPARDAAAAAELLASEKDLAEHVMIVDLVRNDLGRLAVPGTVEAPRRPTLVSLPTVHHLVSEVGCTLAPGWTLPGLLAALFPAGSITGAPKRRTVQIIDELEQRPRGLYCGAILVLAPTELRCSIPIRTGVLDAAGLTVQSGGGIVIDSEAEAERLESWAKVRAFDRAQDA